MDLEKLALAGEIDRDRFSNECVALEFKARVQTQRFFRRHPIPGATSRHDPHYIGYLSSNFSFDEYIRRLDLIGEDEYDPRDYFGDRFDDLQRHPSSSWKAWWNQLPTQDE